MNITIKDDDRVGTAIVAVPNSMISKFNETYPEMAMMVAMEELSELSQAISKCVRNGSKDKKDNLAEEIADALMVIQWVINRFNIPLQEIAKWAEEKQTRFIERNKTDEVIFRSTEAKESYAEKRITPNSLCISKINDKGKYILNGDIDNLAEYYHVILTSLREKSKDYPDLIGEANSNDMHDLFDLFCDDSLKTSQPDDKLSKKQEKKNSKDLDKILEKASKKIKKTKKDDKKDSKKGKKGKK